MSIGYNIRAYREKAGMTQEDLGSQVGVSKIWISTLERGIKVPNLEMAEKIAIALDTTIDVLMKGKENAHV